MNSFKEMGELLPISNYKGGKGINARYLHAFLGSNQQFTDWIKARIKQYDFEENVDYQVFYYDYKGDEIPLHKIMKSDNQYFSKIEYAISLDMAKELAMVERNKKGKMARKYFIHCETLLKKTGKPVDLICGVEPMIYNGYTFYNYREMCNASGVKPNSDRKKRHPNCFNKIFGQLFVTIQYARLMEGRAQLRALKAKADSMQLPLFSDDDTEI